MDQLLHEQTGRRMAAVAIESTSSELSLTPFRCELVSRTQAEGLRPGDQIAAPGRPASAAHSVIAAGLVWEPSGGSLDPFREEDQ